MKTPFVTKDQLEAIAAQYPTPFHIYDEQGIRENARRLRKAFAWNPGYREYFAVKAAPTPALLKLLHEEGCGCDCSSMTELMISERCGITGENIMFSSNDTPAEEFQMADRLGAIINLDDLTLVDYLERSIGHVPEKICCRYNPGGVFTLGETREGFQVMDNPGDAKYGMTRAQIAEAFTRLSAMGAKEFGIHAFLASNTLSNDYYPALARILFQLAAELKAETGVHITFINLSGGVGIPYRPEQPANDIAVIGEGVRRAYEEVLVPAGMGDVALYTELGRFMTGPYGHLVTRAIHEKHIYKEYIGVDACACNLMRPAMYGSYHHITVMGKEDQPCDHKYDIAGSLCENNDKFAVDRMLPKIDMGDLLVIHDTGAHGFSMGYNYNGKLRSAELLLKEDGSVELIRRAARLFDRVIALVMVNDQKQALFSLEERFSLVKESVAGIPGAEADFFGGMPYDYIRDHGVDAIVKGLRNAQDFTYECEIARFNQLHAPQAETLFLYAEPRWDHVSSSRVKEAFLAGEDVSAWVAPPVRKALEKKLGAQRHTHRQ